MLKKTHFFQFFPVFLFVVPSFFFSFFCLSSQFFQFFLCRSSFSSLSLPVYFSFPVPRQRTKSDVFEACTLGYRRFWTYSQFFGRFEERFTEQNIDSVTSQFTEPINNYQICLLMSEAGETRFSDFLRFFFRLFSVFFSFFFRFFFGFFFAVFGFFLGFFQFFFGFFCRFQFFFQIIFGFFSVFFAVFGFFFQFFSVFFSVFFAGFGFFFRFFSVFFPFFLPVSVFLLIRDPI